MRLRFAVLILLACGLPATVVQAAGDFQPDPRSVQRYGPAYRYPQAGWIVLHIEGEPYERGVQHGQLLAPEIAGHIRCFAAMMSPKAPTEGWKQVRTLCNALFVRRYDEEYLKEMKGIADGASAAGARFDDRPLDLVDIVALNAWPEVDTLDSALAATPTGLEGIRFPHQPAQPKAKPKPMRCSAFAANGPATRDGKIVFGHITMFHLYPCNFYNVWLDVKPTAGHRVLMQSYPGGIQSGMDYYLNDAGILCLETTLAQTRFEIKGQTVASRIRKALQYADSIDKVAEILQKENNGLYTNEWLLADIKTNEIAMYELGTYKSKLWRSSKDEWYGGTKGFYWGCNNTKDIDVRLETIASNDGQPGNAVFRPSDRDRTWLRLYDKYKGQMDVDFGKLAFTTPPLAAYPSCDAKFTTTALAKELKSWALFGPPLGRTWKPTFEDRQKYPEIQPLVSNPWTVLHAGAPAGSKSTGPAVVDLKYPKEDKDTDESHGEKNLPTRPAWHGTLRPASDADVWLATGFANYERIVAQEKELKAQASDGKLTQEDRDRLALAMFAHRAEYELASRSQPEKPLKDTRSELRTDEWYRVAAGKGVLLLAELRSQLGAEVFDELMDQFGRANAGKTVTTEQFTAHVEKKTGKNLKEFFARWLQEKGLPSRPTSGPFSVLSFHQELEQTLIIYGTVDETPTNKEAAEALQQAIRARHSNYTVPIKSDREATANDLKNNHLLLIGRPDSNALVKRFARGLPVKFESRSFVVRDEAYAHAQSAVIAAAENPENKRFSLVVIAGLGASATVKAAPLLVERNERPAEVVVLAHGKPARPLVVAKTDK